MNVFLTAALPFQLQQYLERKMLRVVQQRKLLLTDYECFCHFVKSNLICLDALLTCFNTFTCFDFFISGG